MKEYNFVFKKTIETYANVTINAHTVEEARNFALEMIMNGEIKYNPFHKDSQVYEDIEAIGQPIHEDKWEDAQTLAILNPITFEALPQKHLNQLRIQDMVKISNGGERFWVTIDAICDDEIVGTVDNHLISENLDYNYGDKVRFHKKNVYQIIRGY